MSPPTRELMRPSSPPEPLRLSAQRRSAMRALLMSIAIGILVVFSLSGLVYRELWQATGRDLTRFLPDTVWAYAATPNPWATLQRATKMRRWRHPAEIAEALSGGGYLESDPGAELGGIPLDLVIDTLRSADEVSFAVLPTEAGPATLVFIEIREPRKRKRIQSRFSPLLEPVARHVGFLIEAVRQSPWRRYAGLPPAPPRVTAMDSRIILAWGPPEALDDLLEARVGGESEALRRRSGLEGLAAASLTEQSALAVVDPVAAWRLIINGEPERAEGARLVDGLDVATLRSMVDDERERLGLDLRLHDRQASERLRLALTGAPHELIALAPSESPWVISLHTARPLTTLSALRTLIQRIASEVGAEALPQLSELAERLSSIELEALVRLDWTIEAAFAGELALMGLPSDSHPLGEGWALIARLADPQLVERTLESLLPFILGDSSAYGTVYDAEGRALHLVRPSAGAAPWAEVLAWRVEGGLLEVASTSAELARLEASQRSAQTYGDTGLAARALEGLPEEGAAVALIHPSLVAALGSPALTLTAERLDPDFRVAFVLVADLPWLRLSSNLGPWTVGTTLATADRAALDRLTLTGLSPACRAAHQAMCARWPNAVPCRPLSFGRRAHIERACRERARRERARREGGDDEGARAAP